MSTRIKEVFGTYSGDVDNPSNPRVYVRLETEGMTTMDPSIKEVMLELTSAEAQDLAISLEVKAARLYDILEGNI